MTINAKFKHLRRTYDNKLYATICTVTDTTDPEYVGYGVAICGDNENFSRREGRDKSYRRAVRAIRSKKRDKEIRNLKIHNVLYFLDNNPTFEAFPYKVLPWKIGHDTITAANRCCE